MASDAQDEESFFATPPGNWHPKQRWIFAALVIGLAAAYFVLYWGGCSFGNPLMLHTDEMGVTGQAMVMISAHTLMPPIGDLYGTLTIYIQVGICLAVDFVHTYLYSGAGGQAPAVRVSDLRLDAPEPAFFDYLLAGRLSSAVYGGVLIFYVYRLGVLLFKNRFAALGASAAVLLDPLIVEHSHFSTPNILMAVFAIASCYYSTLAVATGNSRHLYVGAVGAGLAFAAKAIMFPACIPVGVACVLLKGRRCLPSLILTGLAYSVTYLVTTPIIVLDTAQFVKEIREEALVYAKALIPDDMCLRGWIFGPAWVRDYARRFPVLAPFAYWSRYGAVFFLAGFAGLMATASKEPRKCIVTLSLPLAYLLLMGSNKLIFSRNYTVLSPFWGLGFVGAVFYLCRTGRNAGKAGRTSFRKICAIGAVMLVVVGLWGPVERVAALTAQFHAKSPYEAAREWLLAHVPAGAKVVTEDLWLPVQVPFRSDPFQLTVVGDSFWLPPEDEQLGNAFFGIPYVEYMDQDYIVGLSRGAYDSYSWYHGRYFFPAPDSELGRYLKTNMELNDKRLPVAVRITPEELHYHNRTELYVDHNIYIYQVPKMSLVRVSAARLAETNPTLEMNGEDAILSEGMSATSDLPLARGTYDVFLRLKPENETSLPIAVGITVGPGNVQGEVSVAFKCSQCYFAGTYDSRTSEPFPIRLEVKDGQVLLQEIIAATVTRP